MVDPKKLLFSESEKILDKIEALEDDKADLVKRFAAAKKEYVTAVGHAESRIEQLEEERARMLSLIELADSNGL